jgi:hypothetical protein
VLIALQLLDRAHDGPPDRRPLSITVLEQLIRPLGCPGPGILAVLVDEELGRSVDAEIGNLVWARFGVAE